MEQLWPCHGREEGSLFGNTKIVFIDEKIKKSCYRSYKKVNFRFSDYVLTMLGLRFKRLRSNKSKSPLHKEYGK